MITSCYSLLFFSSLWLAFSSSFAYASQTFNWTFIDIPDDTTLSACRNVSISLSIDPQNPPTPPYYLFAYEETGPTTIANLGSDVADLTWLVDHLAGTNLLVTVIDSKGNSGGIGPGAFFVFSDGDNSCQPFVPSPIIITSNLTSTKTIQTCAPLELTIDGGQKPYTASLAITGAPTILNFTMGVNDDTLIWYNRAPPPENILFTASDATGQYSFSTKLGISSGLSNGDCGALPEALGFASTGGSTSTFSVPSSTGTTSSTPSALSSTPSSHPAEFSKKKTNGGAIAGGVVAGVAVIVLIIFGVYRCLSNRRQGLINRDAVLGAVTPFAAGGRMSQLERGMSDTSSMQLLPRPTKVGDLAQVPVQPSSSSSSSSTITREITSTSASAPIPDTSGQPAAQPVVIRQHVDIADASPDDLMELPPAYSDRRARQQQRFRRK